MSDLTIPESPFYLDILQRLSFKHQLILKLFNKVFFFQSNYNIHKNSIMQKYFFLILISLSSGFISTIKACTIFSCVRGSEVFAAANEDDMTPFTKVWYNPATKDRYASVCFGAPDMQIASAMNEHGLFFDYAAANYDLSKLALTNPYPGDIMWEVLEKCKTVKEALLILKKYDYVSKSQVLLADKEGNPC